MTDQATETPVLQWDGTLDGSGDSQQLPYNTLPKGNYWFKVLNVGKDFDSRDQCPVANISMVAGNEDGSLYTAMNHKLKLLGGDSIFHRLLHSFFQSIGLRKHGEAFKMDWSKVPGAIGYAALEPNEWTDRETNEKRSNTRVYWYKDKPAGVQPPEWLVEFATAKPATAPASTGPADDDDAPF